jgi:hypothetical protein
MFLEQTATFALYSTNYLVFITEVEGVYSAVRPELLHNNNNNNNNNNYYYYYYYYHYLLYAGYLHIYS